MAIQRIDPLRDLADLQARVSRMFDEALARAFTPAGGEDPTAWTPPVDLVEEGSRYLLRADLPGVAPAEVEVHVEAGTLRVRGERRRDPGVPRESYLRAERPSGRFALHFSLPPSVDAAAIRATQRDGVLEVDLPKKQAAAAERIRVEVDGRSSS